MDSVWLVKWKHSNSRTWIGTHWVAHLMLGLEAADNHPSGGVVYVMYDKAGMSHGESRQALEKNFYRFPSLGNEIRDL